MERPMQRIFHRLVTVVHLNLDVAAGHRDHGSRCGAGQRVHLRVSRGPRCESDACAMDGTVSSGGYSDRRSGGRHYRPYLTVALTLTAGTHLFAVLPWGFFGGQALNFDFGSSFSSSTARSLALWLTQIWKRLSSFSTMGSPARPV